MMEFDAKLSAPTASLWVSAGGTGVYGMDCLMDANRDWLFVADQSWGVKAYDRTQGKPSNNNDNVVWSITKSDMGVGATTTVKVSPDGKTLAFAATPHRVGTINIETKQVTEYSTSLAHQAQSTARQPTQRSLPVHGA